MSVPKTSDPMRMADVGHLVDELNAMRRRHDLDPIAVMITTSDPLEVPADWTGEGPRIIDDNPAIGIIARARMTRPGHLHVIIRRWDDLNYGELLWLAADASGTGS